ncbi:MAG: asparaginase [Jatrophihabitantaceae bacterium]
MITLSAGARLVEVERSGVVESAHTGHLVVLDAEGRIRFQAGDPDQVVFARSSLKPLQAVGMLDTGIRLSRPETALAASSHSGSEQHRLLIEQCLRAAGLSEADLACPPALPAGEPERRAYLAAGHPESRLAMNCSGKHTAMLLSCLANDWPLSGYLAPSHPLQQRLAATVAELGGEPVAATAVDGCGAPLFGISLVAVARAFSRIATAAGHPAAVADAMRSHPELVGGEQRAVTVLMRRVPGLIAKDGAEGGFAAALPDGGALAVKIDDGAARAAECAAAWALHHLGVDTGLLTELAQAPVLGGGQPVGLVRPAAGW